MLAFERGADAFVEFVSNVYETELEGVQFARDAWKEERRGDVDALVNACSAEPGVKAARELCGTLVMGPACAAMHVASMLGRKFSYVIAGSEATDDGAVRIREVILSAAEHYGLAHKLASIRTVPVSPLGFKEDLLAEQELEYLKEVALAEALKAIREDDADVVVGYGGPELYAHLREGLATLGIPVVSPDLALLKVTEMLARLGLAQSKRTYPTPAKVYDFTIEAVPVAAATSGGLERA